METERFGPVHPGDVQQAVAGLCGVYTVQELYARYCEVARGNRHHPGHVRAVGQILVKMGLARRKQSGTTFYAIWY